MIVTQAITKGIILETEDGKTRIEVRLEHENVWLTQKLMAKLFECTIDNISLHLRNIYESGELSGGATTEEFSVVRVEGNRRVKCNMGLTTWRKAPAGKILPQDVKIAKNYLKKNELESLNHIVTMYLDYAEFQASRSRPMYMRDWSGKLDAFLKFNEQDILHDKGKVSHDVAVALAEKEYETFRVVQDKKYVSDFDKAVKKLIHKKEKRRKKQ